MNRSYRLIHNQRTNTWVAVAENVKGRGKRSSGAVGMVAATGMALGMSLSTAYASSNPPSANQLPAGGQVVAGQASMVQSATTLNINQSSARAALNWTTFNVGSAATVNFNQPSASSVTLNQVLDSNPSQIFGRLNANGQVFFSNPNGVYFAPGASANVGGLVATTHAISVADFMAGKNSFSRNGATGSVVNEGNLTASMGGYIALLAPEVRNNGVIVAQLGTVALAAGEAYSLQLEGASLAHITVSPATIAALVQNGRAVHAPGGLIILSAQAVNSLQGAVVNNSGTLEASGLSSNGGVIRLDAGNGQTSITGTMDVSSATAKGGQVTATGQQVRVGDAAQINASGATGGGTVWVGGDWQGTGDLYQASAVTMAADASIDASATQNGDGGKVVLWSKDSTDFAGRIKASAMGATHKGGNVEVSGKGLLNYTGFTNLLGGSDGLVGNLLLDPYNLYVVAGSGGSLTAAGNNSMLGVDTLTTALSSANVTLSTGSSGTQSGNLGILTDISSSAATSLTLTAAGAIVVDANITLGGALNVQPGGSFVMGANLSSGVGAAISAAGGFTKTGTGTSYLTGSISTTGQAIAIAGPVQVGSFDATGNGVTLNSNGGAVTLSGALSGYSGANLQSYAALIAQNLFDGVTVSASASTLSFNYGTAGSFVFAPLWGMPASVNYLVVGGGGAGGVSNVNYYTGGGGGGGGVANGSATLSSGSLYSLTVGAGGTNSANTAATSGGDSSLVLGSTILAGGGGAGGTWNTSNGTAGAGGANYAAGGGGGGAGSNRGAGAAGGSGTLTGGAGGASGGMTNVGGGGGGAVGAASGYTGGVGYASSITGSSVAYGQGANYHTIASIAGQGGGAYGYGMANANAGAVIMGFTTTTNNATLSKLSINSGAGSVNLHSTVANLSNLTINSGAASQITGAISGSGSLTKAGTGALTLSAQSTFTGGTTVDAGTLVLNDVTGNGTGVILGTLTVNSAGTVQLKGSAGAFGWGTNRVTTLNLNGGLVEAVSGQQHIWNLTGGLNFNGGGTLRSNGGTSDAAATSFWEFGTTSITVTNPTAQAVIAGRVNLRNDVGTPVFTVADGAVANDLLISAAITQGNGTNITKAGLGTLTLTGTNSYSGTTTISAGTLQVGAAGTSGTLGTGGVSNNASLVFDRSDATTVANAIWGTGSLSKVGTNTLTLSGGNSYSGGSTISAGVIKLANNTALGTSTATVANGAALDLNGFSAANALSVIGTGVSSGGVIYNAATTTGTASGAITLSGDSTFKAASTGGLTLGAVNGAYALTVNTGSAAFVQAGIVGGTVAPTSYTVTSGIATLSAAVTAAGPIGISGSNVNLNANLSSSSAGAGILVKTSGNIVAAANETLQTNGGAITLWSDSNADGSGFIQLLNSSMLDSRTNADRTAAKTSLASGGGAITLGGGNGASADLGYASASSTDNAQRGGVNFGDAWINSANNNTLYSGGGNVTIRGSAANGMMGINWVNSGTVNAGTTGTIVLNGTATTGAGIELGSWHNNGAVTMVAGGGSIGTPGISITGSTASAVAWGVASAFSNLQTSGSGGVSITGDSNATTGNGIGLYLGGSIATTGLGAGISALTKGSIHSPYDLSLSTNGGNVLVATDSDGAVGGHFYAANALSVNTSGGNITLGGGNTSGTGYALGTPGATDAEVGIRVTGAVTLNSGGGNISIKGKSGTANSGGGDAAWGVGFDQANTINSGVGTITIDGVGQSSVGAAGDYTAGIFFDIGGNYVTSITSANTTANAIRIIGDATNALNASWNQGIRFHSNLNSITATGIGGGITLQGTRHTGGSVSDIYFGGGNILANGGAINLSGLSTGGTLSLVDTYIGSKAGSTVTSSSSAVTLSADYFTITGTTPGLNIDTTGAVVFTPKSAAFTAASTFSKLSVGQTQTPTALTFGASTNAQDLTISDGAIKTVGAINLYANNLTEGASLQATGAGNGISLLAKGNIVVNNASNTTVTLTTSNGAVLLASDTDGTAGGNISAVDALTINSTGGAITLGGGDSSGSSYALGSLTGTDPYMGIRLIGAATFNSAGGNISVMGKSATTSSNGWAAWGVGFDNTVNINSGTGTVYVEGVSLNTTGGGYAAGVSFNGVTGTNAGAMSITSANTTANAIKIIGDNHLSTAGYEYWGLILRSTATSITATAAGGGITLNGTNPNGWGPSFYLAGGNILAPSGAIHIGALNTGGTIYLGSTTNYGANSNVAGNTTSTSAITIQGDLYNFNNSNPNINTTGAFTVKPFSNGFAQAVYSSWYNFNTTNTNTSNKLTSLTLGKDVGSSDMGIYTTYLNNAQTVNGPISLYGGGVYFSAGATSTASAAPILAKASAQVTVVGVSLLTNGGAITLDSNAAGAATGGIYVLNGSVLDSRTNADRTAATNTTGGGAITLGGGADPSIGYAQNVFSSDAGILLGNWYAGGQNANIAIKSGSGNITMNGKSTQSWNGLSVGIQAWEGVNMDAGTNGNIAITGISSWASGVANWGMDLQAWRSGYASSLFKTTNGNLTLTGTGTGGVAANSGGTSLLAYSAATAITLEATGTGSVTLNGISDGAGSDLRLGYANVLAQSGAITLNGNRAGSLLATSNGYTNTLGYLAGSLVTASTSNIAINTDALSLNGALNTNSTGTLTVQPFGTSFTSALTWPVTNLTVGSSLTGMTLGKPGNTAAITVASAQTVNGPISIYGGNINLNASLTSTASGAAILAKASGNIVQAASTSVTTSNGNVTYWADSDNSGQGYIALNVSSTLATGGGKIVLAGGLDDGGTHAGLAGLTANDGTPDGYAKTTTTASVQNVVDGAGVSVGLAGNTGSSVNLLSGGGDIVIRGQGAASAGVTSQDIFKIDSGTGRVDMQGKSTGTYGIRFGWLGTPNWAISSANTTANAITVAGQGGLLLGNVGSGNMLIQATGAGGGVNLSGVITSTGAAWGTYVTNAGATMQILAQSGPINLTGFRSGTSGDFVSAGSLYLGNRKDGIAINGVTPLVTGSSAAITLNADSFSFVNSGTYLSSTGTLTVQPFSTSFDSAQTWPIASFGSITGITGLTVGKVGNTADITIASATSIAGPIHIYGGNIAINAALTATGTNTITLAATGTATESGASITASSLLLNGSGSYTLGSTTVGTLAATGVTNLNLTDSVALSIGTVGSTSGISASGTVAVSTTTGNLTVSQGITTTNTGTSAIVLNAGVSAAAGGTGTSASGNLIISGTPGLVTGSNGRATLYTGTVVGSTGLTALVGSGSGRFRYGSDESTTGYSTALGTGLYAIYREVPSVTAIGVTASMVYGDSLPSALFVVPNLQNGDVLNPTATVSGGVSTSLNYVVGTHTITPSAVTNGLGYAIGTATPGTLTVTQRALSVNYAGVDRVYNGVDYTSASVSTSDNRITGDLLTLNRSATFADGNASVGKTVSVSAVSLSSADSANYSVTGTGSTTATITKRALTLAATGVDKTYDGNATGAVTLGALGNVMSADSGHVTASVTSATFDSQNAGVGRTEAVVYALGGSAAGNYTLANGATTATINKALLSVTGAVADKTYDGTTNVLGYTPGTLSGLVGSESVTVTSVATFASANAGSAIAVNTRYTLANGTGLASNYAVSSPTLSANINQAALTISANNDARFVTVSDAANYAGVGYSGFVNGETSAVLGGTLSVARSSSGPDGNTGAANTLAGTYTNALTAAGATSANYAISYLPANYTIVGADKLLVRVAHVNAIYGAAPSYTITSAQYLKSDLTTLVDLTSNVSAGGNNITLTDGVGGAASFTLAALSAPTSSSGNLKVGSYQIGATHVMETSSNFSNALTVVGAVAVAQKSLTAVAANVTKVYDGSTSMASLALGLPGKVGGDNLTVSGTGAYASKNASSSAAYSVNGIALTGVDASNYALSSTSLVGNGLITPKTLSVSYTGVNKVYDTSTAATVVTADDRIAGDVLNVLTASHAVFSDKNVALGKSVNLSGVTLSGTDSANYVLLSSSGNTTANITPASLALAGFSGIAKTYDGSANMAFTGVGYGSLTGLLGSDSVSVAGATVFDGASAGSRIVQQGTVALAGTDAGNYALAWTNGSGTINKAALMVRANNDAKFVTQSDASGYNGVDYAGFVNGESSSTAGLAGTLAIARSGANTSAGTYTGVLNASGLTSGNYAIRYAAGDYTIVPAQQLLVKVNNVSSTYGTASSYAIASAQYLNGSNVLTSLTQQSVSANTYTYTDSVGSAITFTLLPNATVNSASGNLVVGNYAITSSENTIVGSNFNAINIVGMQTVTTKSVTVGASGVSKTYDGTTAISGAILSASGVLGADAVTVSGLGTYAAKSAGTSLAYSLTDLSIAGADVGNYYLASSSATGSNGVINQRALTVGYTGVNSVYDGTTNASVSTSDNRLAGDALTIARTATLANKNAGSETVSVTGVSLSGADAINYTLVSTTGSTTATVAQRTLNLSYSGVGKVYDAGSLATVNATDDRISGDALTIGSTAAFDDKNVGAGKTVTVSGVSLSGADALNYALAATSGTTTAAITAKTLSVSYAGVNKTYDSTTAAAVTTTDNHLGSDAISINRAPVFADKNAATGKTVTVSNVSLSGADAGNYTLSASSGSTTADIAKAALTVSGISAANRVYDGGVLATADVTGVIRTGLIGLDVLNVSATGVFADKNVATGKTVTLTSSYSGADAGNYLITGQPTATANITPRTLDVLYTAQDKVYDGSTSAVVSVSDNRISGDALTLNGTAAFSDKNVANGKTVNISGAGLASTDAGNYVLGTIVNPTASITPRTLTVGYTGVDKTYDATTAATVLTSDDRVSSDVLTIGRTATFSDKNAGLGKGVNVTGVSLSSTDAGNYVLVTNTGNTTANIAKADLTLAGTTDATADKTYDGTTNLLTAGYGSLAGVITPSGGTADVVTLTGKAAYASQNVSRDGSGNVIAGAVTDAGFGTGNVLQGNVALAGVDAGNYTLHWTNGSGKISPAPLGINANNDARFYGQTDTAGYAGVSYSGFVNGETSGTAGLTGTLAMARSSLIGDGSADAAGSYTLTPSGLIANNYAVTNQLGTYTIVPAGQLLIKVSNLATTYGSAASYTVSSAQYMSTDLTTITTPTLTYSGNTVTLDGVPIDLAPVSAAYSTAGWLKVGGYQMGGAVVSGSSVNFGGALVVVGAQQVSAKALTPTIIAGTTKTYDGTVAMTGLILGATGVQTSDVVDVTGSGAYANKNVSATQTYTVSGMALTGADASNYYLADSSNVATSTTTGSNGQINPLALTATYTGVNKVYDGLTAATVIATPTSLVAGDSVVIRKTSNFVTLSVANKNVAVGKAINITGISLDPGVLDNSNYYLVTTTATSSADITPKALAISGITASDKVYNRDTTATLVTTGLTETGLIANDVVTLASVTGTFADWNVGTNKAVTLVSTYGGADSGNYTITGQTTTAATIMPLGLTVSLGSGSTKKVYDGTTAMTNLVVNTVGVLGSDAVALDGVGAFDTKNASASANKSYTISGLALSGAGASNYYLSGGTNLSGSDGQITPKALTVTYTGFNKVYDQTTSATVTTADDRIAGDTLAITGTASFADKNAADGIAVGITLVGLSGTDSGNYTVATTGSTTANITKAPLTISGISASDKVYDGNTSAVVNTGSVIETGLFTGDSVTVAATGLFNNQNAATGKTVTLVSTYGGSSLGNYAITGEATTTASITPKAVSVSGSNGLSKTYDGTTLMTGVTIGIVNPGTSVAGTISGDTLTVSGNGAFGDASVSRNSVGAVLSDKSYTLSNLVLGGSSASNYMLSGGVNSVSGTNGKIDPKVLTVTGLASTDRTYNGTAVDALSGTAALNGLVADENFALNGSTGLTGTLASKNAGSEAVTASLVLGTGTNGAIAGNYTLTQPNLASVTIAQASLTVTATADTKAYNGNKLSNTAPSVTTGQVFSGDTLPALGQVFNGQNVSDTTLVTPNSVTVNDGNSGANYSVTLATAAGTITRKELTVTGLASTDQTYNGTTVDTLSGTAALNGLVAGETFALNGSTGLTGTLASKNAGTEDVTASLELGTATNAIADNYTLTQPTLASVTIAQAPLTVTATADTKAYNGNKLSNAAPTVTTGQVFSGDTLPALSQVFNGQNVSDTTLVTPNSVTVSDGNSGANYSVTLATATGTIARQALTATVAAPSKTYDGNATASPALTITNGLVGSETLGITGTATFNSKDVLDASLVTVNSASLADGSNGGLAGNYSLATGQTVGATITPKTLTETGVSTASNKTYDGSTLATVTGAALSGVVAGDAVTLNQAGIFASKNVGTGIAVTASDSLGGASAGNYVFTGLPTGLSANITQLASVAWIGGATGDWSNPANWAGGAIPDLSNVANVVIPSGSNVVFNSAVAGPVNVSQISTGGLTVDSGALNVSSALNLQNYRQSGGSVAGAGSFTGTNSFAQTGGTLAMGGNVDITQAAGNLSFVNISGSNVSLSSPNGGTALGNLSTPGALVVTTNGGAITQSGASALNVGGASTFTASNGGTPADITLTHADNVLTGPVSFNGNNVAITDAGPLTLGTGAAAGDLTLNSTGALNLGTSTVGGNLTAHSGNGNVTQTGALSVGGTTGIAAGTGNIDLTNASNTLTGAVSFNGNNVVITDAGPLTLGTGEATGDLTLNSTGALNLGTSTVGGNLTAHSGNGNVTQTGALSVGGTTGIAAGTGNIDLTNRSNTLSGAVSLNGNNVAVTAAGALTFANVYAMGTLTAVSNGSILQIDGSAISVAGTSIFNSATGIVKLLTSGNALRGGSNLPSTNNVLLPTPMRIALPSPARDPAQLQYVTAAASPFATSASEAIPGNSAQAVSTAGNAAGNVGDASGVGVLVEVVRQPAEGQSGTVSVSVPKDMAAANSSFSFPLPAQIANVELSGGAIIVTQVNNQPLPSWLKFDPRTNVFTAVMIPEGALPLQLLARVGTSVITIEITERLQ